MSEFPEIQPFGPRPASHNEDPSSQEVPRTEAAPAPETHIRESRPDLTVAVFTAFGVGFVLGYLVFRYEDRIRRQTKIDEFLNYAQAWIREQGPKIAEPIRQGLETTGSSVEQAFKKVSAGHPLESLNPFYRPKSRKFLGVFG